MIPLADASFFDRIHLPGGMDKLIFPYFGEEAHDDRVPARGRNRRGVHRHGDEHGVGDVPVDILETSTAYIFVLDVPGLSKFDVQVTVEEESMLVIKSSGKRKREDDEEGGACKYLRLERTAAAVKFLRRFRLPEDAHPSRISARCENGELRVSVEKRPPPEAPRRKTVEVAIA